MIMFKFTVFLGALVFLPLCCFLFYAVKRRMFFKKLNKTKLDNLSPNELAALALKLESFKSPASSFLTLFFICDDINRVDDLYLEFHEEFEKMMAPTSETNDSFYENFKGRVKPELTEKEKVYIENHALTVEELKTVNDNSMNLFGDGFVFIRHFSHESFNVNDNEVISSVADYLHELPFQLKIINSEHKLTFCFVEFLKSLNSCCLNVVKNKAAFNLKKVEFFEKFNASTQNILQILNESKELEK